MLIPSCHIFRMHGNSLEQGLCEPFPFQQILWDRTASLLCVTTPFHPLLLLYCSLPSLLSNIFYSSYLSSLFCLISSHLCFASHLLFHFFPPQFSIPLFFPAQLASLCFFNSFYLRLISSYFNSSLPLHLSSSGAESYGELPDPDKASRFWDELAQVGLPGDVDIQSLFEESGQCWAHHRCALWSQGVCVGEGQSLLNVDRSIDSGSTEVSSPHSTPDKTCL